MQFCKFEVCKRSEYKHSKGIGEHLPSLGIGEEFQLESVLEAIQMLRGGSPTYSFFQLGYNVEGMSFMEGSSKSFSSFSEYRRIKQPLRRAWGMFTDNSGPGFLCCETVKGQSAAQESVTLSSINVIQSRK